MIEKFKNMIVFWGDSVGEEEIEMVFEGVWKRERDCKIYCVTINSWI
jgi:hypothetical protein